MQAACISDLKTCKLTDVNNLNQEKIRGQRGTIRALAEICRFHLIKVARLDFLGAIPPKFEH